jgi:hypothetical protein
MAKIPLHGLFESVLGIGKISSKEQFNQVIKKLEETDEDDMRLERLISGVENTENQSKQA